MRTRSAIAFLSFILMMVTVAAHADCAAPTSPGLRICYPSQGSTVMYVAGIEMAANTASGAVARVEVWDNGTKRDNFRYLPSTLYDGSMTNGWNRVTVRVWDTDGNFYQAVRSFYVTGYGVSVCSEPGKAGVNLCWPRSNSAQPNNATPIAATARGQNSKIKYVNIYVDGKFLVGQGGRSIVTGAGLSAGKHTVTARAVDYAGHIYTATNTFKAFYSYDCNPISGKCSPGVIINKPVSEDVPTTFRVQADVHDNPDPISAMKIYVDGTVKAQSSGPGITTSLTLPSNSTHRMTITAWDIKGKTYTTYQNLYVK